SRSSAWHCRRHSDSKQARSQGYNLRTISRTERGNQKALLYRVAAIARMTPHATLDQHIDLALKQLMQPRRLADAHSDLRLSLTELREPRPQIIHVNAATHSNMQQVREAVGFELSGCFGDPAKRLSYRGQVGFTGGGQDQLPCQPLE